MGRITQPDPVLAVLGAFSRYEKGLRWAREQAAAAWGPMLLESEAFEFRETEYYAAEMGGGLKKVFFAFDSLIDPAELVARKVQANDWEREYARLGCHPEPRPLNLDPGYLNAAKLVLASTKDHAHRVYLDRGIYAEVTLHFQRGQGWQPRPWTFPDYRRDDYRAFFEQCRDEYRRRLRGEPNA